jgi:clan AA aspartic protease
VNGRVDEHRRALWDIRAGDPHAHGLCPITVWIDTAFNGALVFPRSLITQLRLPQEALTEAMLADGSRVVLESYCCLLEWFGQTTRVQVIANDGKFPLLGTELLDRRKLTVNYADQTVSLE